MKNDIYPCIWFDPSKDDAQTAAAFYVNAFPDCKIASNSGMVVNLELLGQKIMMLNGGPQFKPNPSISLFVICRTEEEVEKLWENLSPGSQGLLPLDTYDWSPKYGWLQDKFGVNWQLMLEKPFYTRQKIVPLFFFTGKMHGKAQEAIDFYSAVFKNSKTFGIMNYTIEDQNAYANGMVKHARFELNGYTFMAMDSGVENDFPFTEGISMVVEYENQQEMDDYWEKLTAGEGVESQCGWLKDRFGVSWQIIPRVLFTMMNQPDKERSKRVLDAFLKMTKFDIATLEEAYKGRFQTN